MKTIFERSHWSRLTQRLRVQSIRCAVACMMAIGTISTMMTASLPVHAAIPATERQVLVDLYTETNGAYWGGVWPAWDGAPGTECSWGGVTCNEAQTSVISISLPRSNLNGNLPTSLNQLTALVRFDVSSNRLSGTIPSLSGLIRLQHFNLSRNQFSGFIPSLTGLTVLVEFDVRTNQLTGTLPSLVGRGNLRSINVANNQLSGTIPSVPSPDNLTASQSALCPNAFAPSSDAAWDRATGQTPWSTHCTYNYTVTPVPTANGTIFPATPQQIGAETEFVFDVVPNPGYGVAMAGSCQAGTWSGTSYVLSFFGFAGVPPPMEFSDCVIVPIFSNTRHNVIVSSTAHGTTTPVGTNNVLFGTFFTVTAIPDVGYRAVAGTTCGAHRSLRSLSGNRFATEEPVTRDCLLSVEFRPLVPVFTVMPVASAHGTMIPNVPVNAQEGTRTTFTVTPDAGYRIASVTGCGGTLTGNVYTTGAVTASCAVIATFTLLANGSAQSVPMGGSVFTLTLLLATTGVAWLVTRREHALRQKARTHSSS